MPVYYFTFHAYGTWLPDRPEGSYTYHKGWQPPGHARAETYRSQMTEQAARFDNAYQLLILETLLNGQPLQDYELYALATDESHAYIVIAWRDEREPVRVRVRVRAQVKSSMTRALNQRFGKRKWFVRSAGQTPAEDNEHLDRLAHEYLPKHTGLYWCKSKKRNEA
ncbi:MAG: hypothetical protein AAGB26_01915 [Planctomycetota bacterium]